MMGLTTIIDAQSSASFQEVNLEVVVCRINPVRQIVTFDLASAVKLLEFRNILSSDRCGGTCLLGEQIDRSCFQCRDFRSQRNGIFVGSAKAVSGSPKILSASAFLSSASERIPWKIFQSADSRTRSTVPAFEMLAPRAERLDFRSNSASRFTTSLPDALDSPLSSHCASRMVSSRAQFLQFQEHARFNVG